jgi:GT2 family glycosyltransferase/glycosyltransferase involved in cell wall biosynthesis
MKIRDAIVSDLKLDDKSKNKITKVVKKTVVSRNKIIANIDDPNVKLQSELISIGCNIQRGLTSGLFGKVDVYTPEGIAGWLIDVARPTDSLNIKFYINNSVVASGITNLHRPDISKLIDTKVNCGFFIKWDKDGLSKAIANLKQGQLCRITIVIDDEIQPIDSAISLTVFEIIEFLYPGLVVGSFDYIDENFVAVGWGIPLNGDKTANVQILIDGVVVADKVANLPRPDLIVNYPHNALSGFKIQIPAKIIKSFVCKVDAQVNGVKLSGSPIELDLSRHISLEVSEIKNDKVFVGLNGWCGGEISGELSVDGKIVGVLELKETKIKNIFKGEWQLPKCLIDAQKHVYVFTIRDKNITVRSNAAVMSYPQYRLHLDWFNFNKLSGWGFRNDNSEKLQLALSNNGKVIQQTSTNIARSDVFHAMEFCSNCNVGFEFILPSMANTSAVEFDITDIGTDIVITRISVVNPYESMLTLAQRKITYSNELKLLLPKLILESSGELVHSFKMLPPVKNHQKNNKITVVIPIYGGAVETVECLESVFAAKNNTQNQIIIINDCSPDILIQNYLESLEKRCDPNLIIIHKTINSGFSESVNIGMIVAGNQDVILLNSDTVVQSGWIDRLVATADLDSRIGTITPMSNNAEICTVPYLCKSLPIDDSSLATAVDNAAKVVNSGKIIDIPVAVGFCMYIRRECIDEIGLFDAATWGRGYGEEVDFCLKASANGWRHVMACDTFVVHRGNVSFGNEKLERIKESSVKISALYPFYNQVIQRFIAADPAAENRRAINIELISQSLPQKRILHITHGFGGGTEQYVKDMITLNIEDGYTPLVLRFMDTGVSELDIDLENTNLSGFFADNHNETYATNEIESLKENIIRLNFERLHIHTPFGISIELLNWFTSNYKYDVTIHDYSWICPRVTLTVAAGKYCGEPSVEQCNQCVRFYKPHVGLKNLLDNVDGNVLEYKENLKPIIAGADTIFAGVNDVKQRMEKHGMTGNYKVTPHPVTKNSVFSKSINLAKTSIEDGIIKIALFGAISDIKGFHVLIECAENALKKKLPLHFIVFGYTMNDELCNSFSNIQVLGKYEEEELEELVELHRPHVSFFPSQCPETYSYTLSNSFRLGIFPIVSDIGALSERVASNKHGWIYPIDMCETKICEMLIKHVVTTATN